MQNEAAAAGDDFADFSFVAVDKIAPRLPEHLAAALQSLDASASGGSGAAASSAAAGASGGGVGEEESEEEEELAGFDHDGVGVPPTATSGEEDGTYTHAERPPLDAAAAEELQRHLATLALGEGGVGVGGGGDAGGGGPAAAGAPGV